jgi:hypothetical protein
MVLTCSTNSNLPYRTRAHIAGLYVLLIIRTCSNDQPVIENITHPRPFSYHRSVLHKPHNFLLIGLLFPLFIAVYCPNVGGRRTIKGASNNYICYQFSPSAINNILASVSRYVPGSLSFFLARLAPGKISVLVDAYLNSLDQILVYFCRVWCDGTFPVVWSKVKNHNRIPLWVSDHHGANFHLVLSTHCVPGLPKRDSPSKDDDR